MIELTDTEKTVLKVFMADPATYEAVQKIAKGRIEKERDMYIRNKTQRDGRSPIEIGTQIQIFDEALLLVDAIFKDLRQFQEKTDVPTTNPGR